MGNTEAMMDKIITLREFKRSLEHFLEHSYDEFEKKGYKKMVEESQRNKTHTPFLSVIVRTQGRREESLREVFLCLEGQENQDYEVILIGHKLNDEQTTLIQTILRQQNPEIQKKIRYFPLDYGNRTVPLNVGFANAWGQYIVTLDDDDVVFDNWVSNFYLAAEKHSGKILYNYTLAQNWSVLTLGEYKGGLRAESAFDTEFAKDYNDVLQVELNRCPPVGLAYPSAVFQQLGIIFDEDLATTEDWDYLTRAAFVCGVFSTPEPSCIYRKWINAETSFTVHKQEEWDRNYNTIIKKTDERMLCFPVGAASKIIQLIKDRSWLLSHDEVSAPTNHFFDCERVYIKINNAFSEDNVMHAMEINVSSDGQFRLVYLVKEEFKNSKIFRWDPVEEGILLFKDLLITFEYENGSFVIIKQNKIQHNGKCIDGHIVFAQRDPQFVFTTQNSERLSKLILQGTVSSDLPLEFFEKMSDTRGLKKLLVDKIRR